MVRSRTVRGSALPDDPFRYVCIISTASAAQWWSMASQVNGMQGSGAMSQMKHFAIYNGQNGNTTYQDRALHEVLLAPYEGGYVQGKAAAAMCSFQASQDLSAYLPSSVPSLWPASPYATGTGPQTWPLGEMHFSCEQPLLLNTVVVLNTANPVLTPWRNNVKSVLELDPARDDHT